MHEACYKPEWSSLLIHIYLYRVVLDTPSNVAISLHVNDRNARYSTCPLVTSNRGLPCCPMCTTGTWYATPLMAKSESSKSLYRTTYFGLYGGIPTVHPVNAHKMLVFHHHQSRQYAHGEFCTHAYTAQGAPKYSECIAGWQLHIADQLLFIAG